MVPEVRRTVSGTAYSVYSGGSSWIVLIHGLGLSRQLWQDYTIRLAERYSVLCYDLYGHGESAPNPRQASLSLYAEQIVELLDEEEIDFATLAGFSLGGMINRRFAMDYPDRLRGLVILNAPHDRGTEAQTAVEWRAAQVCKEGVMVTLDSALARWFTAACHAERPDLLAAVRRWRAMVDPTSYAEAAWVLAVGVHELIAPQPAIGTPALVMTCADDRGSTPAMSREITAEILGAKCVIVPGLRHLGLFECPQEFGLEIEEFLEEVSG